MIYDNDTNADKLHAEGDTDLPFNSKNRGDSGIVRKVITNAVKAGMAQTPANHRHDTPIITNSGILLTIFTIHITQHTS